jgi:hypothetical protein
MSVTDENKSPGVKIRNGNARKDIRSPEALLEDLEERGYKLSARDGRLYSEPDGPPIMPVIWHALQANYKKLVRLLSEDVGEDVTDTNCAADAKIKKDNTDWSKVADLQPARGEERDRVLAEYVEANRASSDAVKAAGPKDFVQGMMMHWREMDKRRSGRDREAKRRIDTSKKGEACGRCGRALKEGETVYAKCRVYAGMAGGLMSHPGPRYEAASVRKGCAPEWMAEPKGYNEYTIGGRTVRVPESRGVGERPCSTCERPVVYELTRRAYYRRQVFCSYRCQYTYNNRRRSRRRQRRREKVCEVCSIEFTAKRADAKTCSAACKQKAYRTRAKLASQAKGEPHD